jgi:hypothetical protein
MTTIRAAQSRTNPKPSLREVQAVTNISSDTIERNPLHQALVNAALVDQVAQQIADWIFSKLGDVGSP